LERGGESVRAISGQARRRFAIASSIGKAANYTAAHDEVAR